MSKNMSSAAVVIGALRVNDQIPHHAASNQGQCCLPMSHIKDTWRIGVNI